MSLKKIASIVVSVACVVTCQGIAQAQPLSQTVPSDLSPFTPQEAIDAWESEPDWIEFPLESDFNSGCGFDDYEDFAPELFEGGGEFCSADESEDKKAAAVAECCEDIGGEHYYVVDLIVLAEISIFGVKRVVEQGCEFVMCQYDDSNGACEKAEKACQTALLNNAKKKPWGKLLPAAKITWSVKKACTISGYSCPPPTPAAPGSTEQPL